jgi:cell division septation protein DedD
MSDDLRPDDDLREAYERREQARGTRRAVPALVALAAVAAFAVGVWYAYDQGVKKGQVTPPLIKAEPGPAKVAPENPGGMQVPNQDRQVFDRLAGAPAKAPGVEKLLPPPEKPAPTPAAAPRAPEPPTPPAPPAPTAAAPATVAPAAPPAPPPAKEAVQEAVKESPAPPPPSPPAAAPKAASGGARIQLAAFPEAAAAEASWKKLQQRFPDPLGTLTLTIERADLGAKGVFHRVQAGPFADRASAQAACDKLKAAKQDCLVVGK